MGFFSGSLLINFQGVTPPKNASIIHLHLFVYLVIFLWLVPWDASPRNQPPLKGTYFWNFFQALLGSPVGS